MSDTILQIDGLEKSFGGIAAVDDVSFDVERGTITGLIGPNGAGKTTLLNLLSGFYEADGGRVVLDGERIDGLAPHERARRGMIRTFQRTRELTGITVLENVLLASPERWTESVAAQFGRPGRLATAERDKRERAREILADLDLAPLADEYAGNLSGGQQKLLELGRALMADPDVLLLDEPMAGVNPALEERIVENIEAMRREGCTFVIIEHDMEMIMDVSDEIVALHNGRLLTQGPPSAVRSDEALLEAYLGGSA